MNQNTQIVIQPTQWLTLPSIFKVIGIALAFSLPSVTQAATSILIDAKQNCLESAFGTVSNGSAATFQLPAPGRYVLSIISNNMSCSNGYMLDGCKINSIMVQGGGGNSNSRWGLTITNQSTVVDILGNGSTGFVAYVSDNGCSDNTGTATLLIQKAR